MDPVPEGLQILLNEIRETGIQNNQLYAKAMPVITPTTSIGEFANPLLENSDLLNCFMPEFIKRIVQTTIETKTFENPLRPLYNGEMPLGGINQRIHVNPVKAQQFDCNDFAGLLARYSTDTQVIYNKLNWDAQYCLTISYEDIRDAFTSWANLYKLVEAQTNALTNGAYIDEWYNTKHLISNAYRNNQLVMEVTKAVTNEQTAKELVKMARTLALNLPMPSTQYNSWNLNGGYGLPVETWTSKSDIILMVRTDVLAEIDVDVLARAFNISNTEFIGRVYPVDSFDIINRRTGEKEFDGSNIIAVIGDRSWFDIQEQKRRFNQFFNAKNETWQLFYHVTMMFNTIPFANMVALVTAKPTVPVTGLSYNNTDGITIEAGDSEGLDIQVTPVTATTPITYKITKDGAASSDIDTVISTDTRHITLTPKESATGEYVLTASADQVSVTLNVTVNPAVAAAIVPAADTKAASETKESSAQK